MKREEWKRNWKDRFSSHKEEKKIEKSKYHHNLLYFRTIISFLIFCSNCLQHLELFTLQLIGCYNYAGLIPGPCPPGVHCTYDTHGYNHLVFRVTYWGEQPINISQITIGQTLHFSGQHWNRSAWDLIQVPARPLNQGDLYYFKARGLYAFIDMGITFTQGPFYAKIQTTNNTIHWITLTELPETVRELTETDLLLNTHLTEKSKIISWISIYGLVFLVTAWCTIKKRM